MSQKPQPCVFISYRRSDSPDTVKLIFERLKNGLPRWEVFYDHRSIPPGEPFPAMLRDKVTTADVVLVIVGPRWQELLHARSSQAAEDYVRTEIRLALETGRKVIPVVVTNAPKLSSRELVDYPDLAPLAALNNLAIRPEPDFDRDLASLISYLERIGPGEGSGTLLDNKYKLLREIGSGGMGVVYAAEQSNPRRTVAVKLIKPGMDSREVLARFDAERQALGVMEHANIARVLDAGTTITGRPYFVMEYVNGVPITQYCDEYRLPPEERLKLFTQVCEAVQHAHQKGIIHRDIKPSNVLVEVIDGQPVPKVIDFGLAKALGFKLTDKSLLTSLETRIGTLEYSSPEQAAGKTLLIDTRTDIYSLGALLYEMLTGTPPFSREELGQAGEEEMRRVIWEKDPPIPSAKLSSSNSLPAIAANRHSEPKKLTSLVRGDLDWIVMRALEKEPQRRYKTANDFSQDVERYLTHQPVDAYPPSTGYKLRKFVRRNRGLVSAGALVFLSLIGGLITTSIAFSWAKREQAKAEENFQAAKRHAEIAERQSELALTTLATVIRDIQAGLERFPGSAEIRRKLLQTSLENLSQVATAYVQQTSVDATTFAALIRMGDLVVQFGGEPAVANQLDRVPERLSNEQKSAIDLANKFYLRANEIGEKLAQADPNSPWSYFSLALSHAKLGELLKRAGNLSEALAQHRQELQFSQKSTTLAPDDLEFQVSLAESHCRLGEVIRQTESLSEASEQFQSALAILEKVKSRAPENPDLPSVMSRVHGDLGDTFRQTGNLTEALSHYKLGLEISQAVAASKPIDRTVQDQLANQLKTMGDVLVQSGNLQFARDHFQQAIDIRQRLVKEDPDNTGWERSLSLVFFAYGDLLVMQRQFDDAIANYRSGREISEKLAKNDPRDAVVRYDLAFSHNKIGDILRYMGRAAEAQAEYELGLQRIQMLATSDPGDLLAQRNLAVSYNKLGDMLREADQLDQALEHYQKGLEIRESLAARDPSDAQTQRELSTSLERIGLVHRLSNRQPDALSQFERMLAIKKHISENDPADMLALRELAITYGHLGDVLLASGKSSDAQAQYEQALEIRQRIATQAPENPQAQEDLASSHTQLGGLLSESGANSEAIEHFQQALVICQRRANGAANDAGAQHALMFVHYCLGGVFMAAGRYDEAGQAFRAGASVSQRMIAKGMSVEKSKLDLEELNRNAEQADQTAQAMQPWDDLLQKPTAELLPLLDLRANTLAKQGRMSEATQAAGQLRQLPGATAAQLYNAVCIYSLAGAAIRPAADQTELTSEQANQRQLYLKEAIAALKQAIDAGWENWEHLKSDADLEVLRGLPEYKALLPDEHSGPKEFKPSS